MSRRLPLIPLGVLLALGCARFQTRRDLPPPPPPAPLPSPYAKTPPLTVPDVPAARSAAPDDRKPIRERIADRRDERQQRRDERKETPKPAPEKPADKPAPAAGADDLAAVRKLYALAADRYAKLTDFEAHLTRREVVNGKQTPQEEVLFQYRKQPMSVYMKTTGEAGRGREVLYVQGKFDDKLHVVIAAADANFLMKAGSVQRFDPNNPMVTSRSRKKITEAGFGDLIAKFGAVVEATAAGTRPNGVKYLGTVDRKEYPYPLEGVEVRVQPGDDPHLPKGGVKTAFFDTKPDSPGYGVPVLIITTEPDGKEVEYYLFDHVRSPAGLTDADFHPDRLGKK